MVLPSKEDNEPAQLYQLVLRVGIRGLPQETDPACRSREMGHIACLPCCVFGLMGLAMRSTTKTLLVTAISSLLVVGCEQKQADPNSSEKDQPGES